VWALPDKLGHACLDFETGVAPLNTGATLSRQQQKSVEIREMTAERADRGEVSPQGDEFLQHRGDREGRARTVSIGSDEIPLTLLLV